MALFGIDVSDWQGLIDWEKVKAQGVDFVMLRAGYGAGNIDKRFQRNASELNRLGIPFGVYWFSYAYTQDMARKEAEYCLNTIKPYRVEYPVCFDFEYDSDSYAKEHGVKFVASTLDALGRAFLERIEKSGYYAMNYTNIDFLSRGFSSLTSRFATWLAQWDVKAPTKSCAIWQYSAQVKMNGISGQVDGNYSYKDFKQILTEGGFNGLSKTPDAPASDSSEKHVIYTDKSTRAVKSAYNALYDTLADDVISGKYGNGDERLAKLDSLGYDAFYVQSLVNAKLEK